jgi:hypothetical protein
VRVLASNRFRGAGRAAFLRRFNLHTPWLNLYTKRQARAFLDAYRGWMVPAAEPDFTLLLNAAGVILARSVRSQVRAMQAAPRPYFFRVGEDLEAAEQRVRAFTAPIVAAGEAIAKGSASRRRRNAILTGLCARTYSRKMRGRYRIRRAWTARPSPRRSDVSDRV